MDSIRLIAIIIFMFVILAVLANPALSQAAPSVILQPSKTSGIAPLNVVFDASLTTSPTTSKPFHHLDYSWDFGDSGSGTWDLTGKSRNQAKGPISAHTFQNPGTYTVTLTVKDQNGNAAIRQVQIQVSDPSQVFSGTNTICFSTGTDFTGCPTGAQNITTSNLGNLGNYITSNRRLLLRRGDSWASGSALTINTVGPIYIGAFGSCSSPDARGICSNNPKITATAKNDIFSLSGRIPKLDGLVIEDLNIKGQGGGIGIKADGSFKNLFVNRMTIEGFVNSISIPKSILNYWNSNGYPGHEFYENIAITNSVMKDGTYIIYLTGKNVDISGNGMSNTSLGEHVLRTPFILNAVISNNMMSHASPTKHVLKLHGPVWSESGIGYNSYSERIVLSDNHFISGIHDWNVAIGPENAQEDERVRDVIVERNIFVANSATQVDLILWLQDATVRNNIFDGRGTNTGYTAVSVERRGVEPPPSGVEIYNNLAYYNKDKAFTFSAIKSTASNSIIKNNIASAPLSTQKSMINNNGISTIQENNLLTDSPGFTDPSNGDFRTLSSSPARNAGVSVPVYDDFSGNTRPQEGLYDLGAYEYVVSTTCTDGQKRACPLSAGACQNSQETCSGSVWPGCTSQTYLSNNPNYEATETKCDSLDNDCDGRTDEPCIVATFPDDCFGDCNSPFYKMEITSAEEVGNSVVINTTGASYLITSTGISMVRRIDPKTNSYKDRVVARLEFQSDIGIPYLVKNNKQFAVVVSDKAEFKFYSDSFFLVKAKEPFTYTHRNLIENAPWNKKNNNRYCNDNLEHIWTDGYGGSLHAWYSGPASVTSEGADYTTINIPSGSVMSHMAFPPKKFDFEKLYGEGSIPITHFVYGESAIKSEMSSTRVKELKDNGYGVYMLWNSIYTNERNPKKETDFPVLLESGIMGYEMNKTLEPLVRSFISFAHQNGMKVIFYMHSTNKDWNQWVYPTGHPLAGKNQEMSVNLEWMEGFREDYVFDGWYFDNADTGNLSGDYYFIKSVRENLGDEGIIFHHDSVDVWDGPTRYSGLRAVMIDSYADYTVTGETGKISEVDTPNDLYLRYFTSGYGMSQAFGNHILVTSGKHALSEQEKMRVMGDLNSLERGYSKSFVSTHFIPTYLSRKNQYLSGNFNPDVSWPIDTQNGWFRTPANINVEPITGTSFRISWTTNSLSDSQLAYTKDGYWFKKYSYPGAEGSSNDRNLSTTHSVIIGNLSENSLYEFRIRSGNRAVGLEEIIWGHVGSFTTKSADSDSDGMKDEWEVEYFNGLGRDGKGDYDGDGLKDLEEFTRKTDPTNRDTDYDGIDDYAEVSGGTDPMDWDDPVVNGCVKNNICQKGETPVTCPEDCVKVNGLLAYWSFDLGNAKDQSGNNIHGSLLDVKWHKDLGHNGKGVYEFIMDSYIDTGRFLATPQAYGSGSRNSTIIAWVKPYILGMYNEIVRNLGGFSYLSAGTSNAGKERILRSMVRKGKANVNSWPDSKLTLNENEWSCVAMIFMEGVGVRYYINNVLAGEINDSDYIFFDYYSPSIPNSYIGRGFDWDDGFYGLIDDVMLFNISLTVEEICNFSGMYWNGSSCINTCGNKTCESFESEESCPIDCRKETNKEDNQNTNQQGNVNEGSGGNTGSSGNLPPSTTTQGSGNVSTGSCTTGQSKPCGSSIGECKQGIQNCVNGKWGSCVGAVGPSDEVCDGLDNNCNGQIDENCLCVEGQNKPCGSNIGICRQGVQNCVGGKWGSCVGNTPPLSEDTCFNYLDDNCNGEVDEGCGEAFNTCNNGKLDEGEQGIDCGGKCPKKCPDLELISVLMILVGLFGIIGTTLYMGYFR